ncbi:hypothetical protein ERO13_D06G073750v2 [Gossypium hirsutum]|uniref:Uncharacterized protein n=2 Tax=Gossypium TaxID=3633 RepID=A0A5J5R0T6_GOSBA|nr:hypothetical protein ES319_D06G085300v1 [Gossypium barbadense]KAG4141396.1 hypothetical protein ERO13_D06G073750v2 [Gossypium hirsutum]TXG75536.1 hypothetical protein E1A91_1Z007900v1 [Gossypium mustelinum]
MNSPLILEGQPKYLSQPVPQSAEFPCSFLPPMKPPLILQENEIGILLISPQKNYYLFLFLSRLCVYSATLPVSMGHSLRHRSPWILT